jgi:hypothetical protein
MMTKELPPPSRKVTETSKRRSPSFRMDVNVPFGEVRALATILLTLSGEPGRTPHMSLPVRSSSGDATILPNAGFAAKMKRRDGSPRAGLQRAMPSSSMVR